MKERHDHEYGTDGVCLHCDEMTNDAFWALFGAPPGTQGLRLRPGKEPEFIPAGPPKDPP